jgi:hypothetical protein
VSATIVIGGYHRNCSVTASCSSRIQTHAEIVPKPCPEVPVKVICPATYKIGERAVFAATLIDSKLDEDLTYSWRVNWGRIVEGQGTSKIVVEHNDHWGDRLAATVFIGGPIDPSCARWSASCGAKILE